MPDYSSYPRVQQQANPLAQFGQAVQIQGGLNQNQLFQQEFADRAALNQAYQQSIDPRTGQIDYSRLGPALGASGAGRLLPQALQQQQEMQKRNLETDKLNLEMNVTRANNFANAMSGLVAKQDLTHADVLEVAGRLIANGTTTPSQVAAVLPTLSKNPDELRVQLNNFAMQNLAAADRAKMLLPNVQQVNLGGSVGMVDVNPFTNKGVSGANIPVTMSPAEAATPVPFLAGGNVPAVTTKSELARRGVLQTGPGLTASGLTPSEAAGTRTINLNGQEYTVPTEVWMQLQRQSMGGGMTPGGVPSIGLPSGPPPGFVKGKEIAATSAAEMANEAMTTAQSAPQRIFQLETVAQALANPNVKTGPGTDTFNQFVTVLSNMPGLSKTFDVNAIKDFDTAKKYLIQNAISASQSMGAGTDAKLASAISGNPNMSISKLANQDLLKTAIGIERMQQAVGLAWNQSGLDPDKFNNWAVSFKKDLDPRVFVLDKLPPERQQKLRAEVAAMKPAERQKFEKSFNLAVSTGVLPNIFGGQQ